MHSFLRLTVLLIVSCGVAANASAQLSSRVYATGLSFPVGFYQDPTDARVQFVIQQDGRIRAVRNGTVLPTDFLDLSSVALCCGEQGLLGMAFSPDYAVTGRFYVHFSSENSSSQPNGSHIIARFRRSLGNPLTADISTRFDLRWGGPTGPAFIAQPFGNHNGGAIAFGPDGYLYIALGDGGGAGDPAHRAQNPATFNGKMLRIDVNVPDSDPQGYRVPPDNPFLTGFPVAALPEIWAFGYRNPWRFSFDDPTRGGTGAMLVGDVGQNAWEEIDYEPAGRGGRNYGWRLREGAHSYDGTMPAAYLPVIDPIHEYAHAGSASVTGGIVYRGAALGAAYQGRYFFAEYVQGRVWSIALTVNPMTGEATASDLQDHTTALGGTATLGTISSFGVDAAGELYIVAYTRGMIFRIAGPVVPPRIMWRNQANGQDLVWLLNGGAVTSATPVATIADLNWEVRAGPDLNADRGLDLLWRNKATGQNILWLMNGATITSAVFAPTIANTDWEVKGSGDLDGDGRGDVLWRNKTTGQNIAWLMNGTSIRVAAFLPTIASVDWEVTGTGDLNGDGRADAVWRNKTSGLNVAWLMNGTTIVGAGFLAAMADVNWEIKGLGDLDGDGLADLIWRNKATGANMAWLMNGVTTLSAPALPAIADLNWELRQVGDTDANGKVDILWRNKATGDNLVWLMNGAAVQTSAALPSIADLNWEISGL